MPFSTTNAIHDIVTLLRGKSRDEREQKLLAALEGLTDLSRLPSRVVARELFETFSKRKELQASQHSSRWTGFDSSLLPRLAELGDTRVSVLSPIIDEVLYIVFFTDDEFIGFLDDDMDK